MLWSYRYANRSKICVQSDIKAANCQAPSEREGEWSFPRPPVFFYVKTNTLRSVSILVNSCTFSAWHQNTSSFTIPCLVFWFLAYDVSFMLTRDSTSLSSSSLEHNSPPLHHIIYTCSVEYVILMSRIRLALRIRPITTTIVIYWIEHWIDSHCQWEVRLQTCFFL